MSILKGIFYALIVLVLGGAITAGLGGAGWAVFQHGLTLAGASLYLVSAIGIVLIIGALYALFNTISIAIGAFIIGTMD